MKICLKNFEDFVWPAFQKLLETSKEMPTEKISDVKKRIHQAIVYMWAMAGDEVSKVYSGTASVLTAITLKGHEDFSDKITHYMNSAKRWKIQAFSDDFKQ
jgi:hypothetical protein